MLKSSLSIKNANNVDTSTSRASQIQREIRLLRSDVREGIEEVLEDQRSNKGIESPYAPDRKTIDHAKIHKSPEEREWKHVEGAPKETRQKLVKSYIVKLDII